MLANQATSRAGNSYAVGWVLLLLVAGLMTLNHVSMAFILDEPELFVGFTFFNLYALAVLAIPFHRREMWAWSTTWLLPVGLAIPAFLDANIAAFYLTAAAVCVLGLLLTTRAFAAQDRQVTSRAATVVLALGLGTVGLAACQPLQAPAALPAVAESAAGEDSALPTLTITVTAEGIDVPAQVPAGPTLINLVNQSGAAGPDGAPILPEVGRLTAGATVEDLVTLLPSAMQNPTGLLAILKMYGSAIAPTARLVWDLQPGDHVAMVTAGEPMVQSFVVTASGSRTNEPAADVQVQLQDFAFVMPDSVAAGPLLWEISNAGTQWHELVIISLPAGVTVEDALAALPAEGPPTGPLPFEIVWGYVTIAEGNRAWAEIDLSPGEYTVICFLPDLQGDMAPHATHGMVRTLTVD
ncbi:MAG: hypothetical protein ACRC1H_08800 [Caldilineaceae bacterium]